MQSEQNANSTIPKKNKKKRKNKKRNKKKKIVNVDFPVDVFLRMRPLIKHEIDAEHEEINYNIKTDEETQTKKFILSINQRGRDRKLEFKGLRNVILAKHNNEYVFNTCIMPCIDALFEGTPCAAFAYGHSGSGKV